jgi:hypothetical protein
LGIPKKKKMSNNLNTTQIPIYNLFIEPIIEISSSFFIIFLYFIIFFVLIIFFITNLKKIDCPKIIIFLFLLFLIISVIFVKILKIIKSSTIW